MAFFKDHVVAALYDDFPHPVFLIDAAKRIEAANRAAVDLFG
ncbi:PAS domain-containing protein, partial [Rhizobium alarense]